jgi:Putative DNA-binding domain
MPDLLALQHEMVKAILTGGMETIAPEFTAGTGSASARLNIFRNNTFASLTECLRIVFPVTQELSDERFFAYAAHEFVARHPPREARLSEFGADFPRFLAIFEPCREFPIIAEMAALEWAIALTLNSAEETPAPICAINGLRAGQLDVGFSLQPHLHFTISRWPLIGVWADHKRDPVVISGPLAKKTSRVAITRQGEDIQMVELDAARFAFWRALARGLPLELAARRALALDPLFDLLRETLLLFKSQLITRVHALKEGDEK